MKTKYSTYLVAGLSKTEDILDTEYGPKFHSLSVGFMI